MRARLGFVFAALLIILSPPPASAASDKAVVGWVENVRLFPGDVRVKAKLDTGAKMSSLTCDCLNPVKRNGEAWIGFRVKDKNGKLFGFERRIVGYVRVKRHFGKVQRRPIVTLGICVGDVYKVARVNLVDRSGLHYDMLIGRNDMRGHFIVDPDETFRSNPRCNGVLKVE